MLKYNIIVSVNENNIIGIDNDLLIYCKDDLKQFYKITTRKYPESRLDSQNICIMGYNTWLSIPANVKPLPNRMILIISANHTIKETPNCKCFKSLSSAFEWSIFNQTGKIFVIGGESIFKECLSSHKKELDCIYLTQFINNFKVEEKRCSFFPNQLFDDTTVIYNGDIKTSECSTPIHCLTEINHSLKIYQRSDNINKGEYEYLHIMKSILDRNNTVESRNATVFNSFGERMIFDMKDGFPLLTTKKIGSKTILRELLWFINGSTNNNELKEKNVHIWDQNASKEFLESRKLDYAEGDLGPIYGFQWRHFGAEYKDCHSNYEGLGIDQLKNIIHLIQTDPTSRRIIMSAWNPLDIDKMALPPCHVMCQFSVNQNQGTIDCQLYQRSGDMFLGVPFNIASYAFLLCIICRITKYNPGKLIHILGDTHIYEDHIKSVKEQLTRVPVQFPTLDISDELQSIDDIKEEYFTINNYQSYPKIIAQMVA